MRILIDADGCPVVKCTVSVAGKYKIPVIILCDSAHEFHIDGVQTITVSKGADAVDFRLVNLLESNDIVITQDYGLAAMCLARNARVLRQDGMEFHQDNIDALLFARHTAKKIRRSGGRLKGSPKRDPRSADQAFREALKNIIQQEKAANHNG